MEHRGSSSGVVPLIGNPLKLSATPVSYRLAPPLRGEHTEQVMSEIESGRDLNRVYGFPLSQPNRKNCRHGPRSCPTDPSETAPVASIETESYPWDTVGDLVEAGFMGMTIPAQFGGRGLSYLDAVLVIEQLSRSCGVTGRIVVEANMGAVGAVMAYGSEDQKRMVAAHVLAGDKPAICITEPEAGSAATDMQTTAERVAGRVRGQRDQVLDHRRRGEPGPPGVRARRRGR